MKHFFTCVRSSVSVIMLLSMSLGVVTLNGCATTSVNKAFQAGYGTIKIVQLTSVDLLNTDKISAEEGEAVLEATDDATTALDALWATKDVAADSSLGEVRRITTGLKVFLTNLIKEDD